MQRILTLPFQDRPRADREIAELLRHVSPETVDLIDAMLAASPAP
jgi:hypothetical protein